MLRQQEAEGRRFDIVSLFDARDETVNRAAGCCTIAEHLRRAPICFKAAWLCIGLQQRLLAKNPGQQRHHIKPAATLLRMLAATERR